MDNNNIYSFVVVNNNIIDYAHNIMMKYDDYIKLVHSKKIIYVQANRIIKNIDRLYERDEERDNGQAKILNYALHKYKKIIYSIVLINDKICYNN